MTFEQLLELFRILERLLRLPEALEGEFMYELIAFEEQAKMPYVTSIERLGHEAGRRAGEALILLRPIELKFGPPSEAVRGQINAADADSLLRWSERILTAQTLEDFLR